MWDLSSLKITPETLLLISEIERFKESWRLLGQLTPEKLLALRKVATIESIGSSTRIEGSKLSDREVELLLSGLTDSSFGARDEQEVRGYSDVCEKIFQSYAHIPFSENTIKQLHGWLLKYSEKDQRHRGEYKKLSNNVEAFDSTGKSLGIIFETTSPFDTPREMEALVTWTRTEMEKKTLHSLLIVSLFVVGFLAIHPFQDGNGRLSRCLTTLLLLQMGYSYASYSSLESIIEQNKEGYYLALRRTQGTLKSSHPDFDPWIHFFLRALNRQKVHLEHKVEEAKSLIDLPSSTEEIIRLLKTQGRLSVGEIAKHTGLNRNTLKKHLTILVESHHIQRHGKGRGAGYSA